MANQNFGLLKSKFKVIWVEICQFEKNPENLRLRKNVSICSTIHSNTLGKPKVPKFLILILKSWTGLKYLIGNLWQRLVAPYKIRKLVLCLETKLNCNTERITSMHTSAVEQYLKSTSVKAVALLAVAVICSYLTEKSSRSLIEKVWSVEEIISIFRL